MTKISAILLFPILLQTSLNIVRSQVHISGHVLNAPQNSQFEITFFNNNIEYIEKIAANKTLNYNGKFSTSFSWDTPKIATLSIADEHTQVYLTPGDSLFVTVNYDVFDSTLKYQGIGEDNNNYLAVQAQKFYTKKAYRHTKDQDPFVYLEYVDSIQNLNINLYNSFDTTQFSSEFKKFMNHYFKYRYVDPRWMFKVDFNKYDEKGKPSYKELPDEYFQFIRNINLNDQEAHNNSNYSNALGRFIFETMTKQGYYLDSSSKVNHKPNYVNRYYFIKSTFSGKILDFQLTKLMNHYISSKSQDESWEEIMEDYKNTCNNKMYLELIKTKSQRLNYLHSGETLPNFSLENLSGDIISLKSLRGKVVIIDFWATWCKSCLSMMNKTEEIEQVFENDSNVVVLFINMDDDKEKWKSFIQRKGIHGLHLFANKEQSIELRQNFSINGLPYFILIDRKGKLIKADISPDFSTERRIQLLLE